MRSGRFAFFVEELSWRMEGGMNDGMRCDDGRLLFGAAETDCRMQQMMRAAIFIVAIVVACFMFRSREDISLFLQ